MRGRVLPVSAGKGIYWHSLRVHVHQILAWGFTDAKPRFAAVALEEEDITGFVVEAIQARLRRNDAPKWCSQYAVKENTPIPGPGRTGKRRKRPDIILECTKRGRPEYLFEAKPICVGRYPVSHYTGVDALQRYIRGEYASQYPEAAMIGYVLSHTVVDWARWIKDAIDEDATGLNALLLLSEQKDVSIVSDISHEWVSEHGRHVGNPTSIFHVLLDCIM